MSTEIKDEAKRLFIEYLERKGQRKTPERFAILDEIYSNKMHFDAETLFEHMMTRKCRVSLATVYNTLDLLQECGLVVKQQFGHNLALFERSYGYKQHDHIICHKCNNVLEFCDPRIQQTRNLIGEIMHFKITGHALNLYGEPEVDKNGCCLSCKKSVMEHAV